MSWLASVRVGFNKAIAINRYRYFEGSDWGIGKSLYRGVYCVYALSPDNLVSDPKKYKWVFSLFRLQFFRVSKNYSGIEKFQVEEPQVGEIYYPFI
jgi:hypothetical protein